MPTINRDGHELYFSDSGQGFPVLLGHSFLCSGEMWAPQVPRLAERYRVINVDYRGHGRSSPVHDAYSLYDLVDDQVAVLDHLGIEKAVWGGLSIGGMVALRAALTVPDRVAGLILVDTQAGPETAFKKVKYRAMGLGARLLGIRPLLPSVLPLMFGRTTRTHQRELVGEWRRRFSELHVPSILAGLSALVRRDSVVDRLPEIGVPATVLVGDEDITLPRPCSEQIVAGLRHANLVVIEGAGHLSALEQPEAVTGEMLTFLAGLGLPAVP